MKNTFFRICFVLAAAGLSSFASASRFVQTCQTTNYFVSITDNPRTGELDYRSWHVKEGEPLVDAPDLYLTGGIAAGGGGNYGVAFRNGEYVYSLQVRHDPEEGPLRFLKVTKGENYKVLLAEVCLY